MRRRGPAGLAASLVLAMLVAACGASGAGGSGPTVAPVTTAPAAPEPAAALGLFTGRDVCGDVPQSDPSAEDDAEAIRCERTTTDARMSGTLLSKGLPEGGGENPEIYTSWMQLTLTNDGGTWSCDEAMMGMVKFGTGWRDQVCVGEGAYTGLTAYIHSISHDAATTFGVFGWIEEAP